MKNWPLLALLSVLCTLLSTGCATNRPMVNTWRNPAFSPSPTNTITLKSNVNAPPWDLATTRVLAEEMEREGFKPAPEARSDYLLTCVNSGNLVEHDLTEKHAVTAPPPDSGLPAAAPGTVFTYSSVQKSYLVPTQDLRLFLYSNPKTNPAGLQLVWQGTITLGKKDSARDEQILIRTLLHYFGGDKNGPVDLVP